MYLTGSHTLHTPLIITNHNLDVLLVVYDRYGLALSAINHQQDVGVVFVKVTLLNKSTGDKYKFYLHKVFNHVITE